MTAVSVVVLSHGDDPWLERSVRSVLESEDIDPEVVLVDNGCTDGAVARVADLPGVTVVRPGRNLGFAGGCDLGAEHARADVLAFLNSDAELGPRALRALVDGAVRPDVGIATASVRLADQPHLLNSGGNEIHFLGFSWAGRFGEPADAETSEREVAAASGAAFAVRRETWNELGGFEERFFMYSEDADLSLRCWQRGLRVVYVPDAVVVHRYEFSRNPTKLYLLERNRLVMLLTLFERRTLVLLLPAFLAVEPAVCGLALAQGWFRQKLRGYAWLLRNRRWIFERRREMQSQRRERDVAIASRLSSRLAPGNFEIPSLFRPFDRILAAYWAVVQKLLARAR